MWVSDAEEGVAVIVRGDGKGVKKGFVECGKD